ncbi:MAG TPA: YncE family protein, partial [Roseiarcus sp.]|nr:YncE family protein [Roseiarcus sp.]
MRAMKDIEVGEGPFALAFDKAGNRLFVAAVRNGEVTVIDGATQAVTARIAVGGAPYGIAVDTEGDRVLVTNQHADRVSIIDQTRLRLIATIGVGRYPEAVTTWRGKAYVANW